MILDERETLELLYGDLRVKPDLSEPQPLSSFEVAPSPQELKSSTQFVVWGSLLIAGSVGILIAWLIDCFRR